MKLYTHKDLLLYSQPGTIIQAWEKLKKTTPPESFTIRAVPITPINPDDKITKCYIVLVAALPIATAAFPTNELEEHDIDE